MSERGFLSVVLLNFEQTVPTPRPHRPPVRRRVRGSVFVRIEMVLGEFRVFAFWCFCCFRGRFFPPLEKETYAPEAPSTTTRYNFQEVPRYDLHDFFWIARAGDRWLLFCRGATTIYEFNLHKFRLPISIANCTKAVWAKSLHCSLVLVELRLGIWTALGAGLGEQKTG